MSRNYKFKSLTIAQNSQEKSTPQKDPDRLTVFEVGDTRTIDFVMLNGTRQNFPYIHYLTSWLGKDGDAKKSERVLKIFFATHLVTIKGYCLDEIYNHLTDLDVKSVQANDMRYASNIDDGKAFVTHIAVTWKKEGDINNQE